jgi:CubicO group peptidase (beta-lactamase class C family)
VSPSPVRAAPRRQRFLDETAAAGVFSAVTALVGSRAGVEWQGAAGLARPGVPARPGTVYDYGSLTKPFVATLALALDAAGLLPLGLPIGDVFPGTRPDLARRPLEDLLRHRAGVTPWAPLYARCRSLAEVLDLIAGPDLPRVRSGLYSDLDFILWGAAAERLLGRPLADLLAERVAAPLGLASVVPPPGDRPEVAESRMGTGMEVELARLAGIAVPDLGPPGIGKVQDGNARFLIRLQAGGGAGVCGHAGLFGTAADLYRLGLEWLLPGRLLEPGKVAAALQGGEGGSSSLGALGWWKRRRGSGGGGAALPRGSFGHTGFPGGNLWIDPAAGRIVVLLGHRIEPLVDVNPERRQFHKVVYDT